MAALVGVPRTDFVLASIAQPVPHACPHLRMAAGSFYCDEQAPREVVNTVIKGLDDRRYIDLPTLAAYCLWYDNICSGYKGNNNHSE